MSISANEVRFTDATMWVSLSGGRTYRVPLAWFPRLMNPSPEAVRNVQISPFGLHWEKLDEDLSVPSLLAGQKGETA
jgi:hypothetical protein